MAKMTKGDLAKFRKDFKKDNKVKGEIMISMGTCGIAAGANDVLRHITETLQENGVTNISVRKTGCLGMCFCEPNLAVRVDGMPEIFYGNVNEQVAMSIVTEHIMKKQIVKNNVIFMPTKDTGKKLFKSAEAGK